MKKPENFESKVAKVTLGFWIIKVVATTLGETGGDALSMGLHLGYAISTVIFFGLFLLAVSTQMLVKSFHPFLYWAVIVTTTTAGTTMADFADRSLGIGYAGGTFTLFLLLVASLMAWRLSVDSISVNNITSPRVEMFYWVTILFSNTLGTALGDFTADDSGLGYGGSALVFSGVLAMVSIAYYFTSASRAVLFWIAFIFTRPLGATLGDFLTKPAGKGGLDLSQLSSSACLAAAMIALIFFVNKKNLRVS